jgi:16S rRNA (guanine527-N7)-methyltransferase
MLLTDEISARRYVAARSGPEAIEKLERLADALRAENGRQNLVAPATLDTVWLRHIADSAQLLEHVPDDLSPWVDLGSGAGFPGLVIAIMRPSLEVVLVESRRLRVQWLEGIISRLDLSNCSVLAGDALKVSGPKAGVISARAFARLPRLVAISARFSTDRTWWVLPKGRSAAQEVSELPNGMRTMFHVKPSLTDPASGIVVKIGDTGIPA